MSKTFNNLAGTIRSILASTSNPLMDNEKNTLIAIAIARALSIHFPLPTSAVNSVAIHFATAHDEQLCKVIAAFNENIIINTQLTRDLTFKFYQLRYDLVFTPRSFEKSIPVIAACLPEYFPEDICEVLQKEVARSTIDKENYWSSWTNMVNTVVEGINGELAEKVAVPLNVIC